MKIDLHIHTRTGSDGALTVGEVFGEAKSRGIEFISITDHDAIDSQERAISLANEYDIAYVTGIELNVSFWHANDKPSSLDFLGYKYDINSQELRVKLRLLKDHRERRAKQILENLNAEFDNEGIERFTEQDIRRIQDSVDGVLGRVHIANYLIDKGIVQDKQEAFNKYLITCDVPKYPLRLAEASSLIRNAGGILVLAHPNDPQGTSLASITQDLQEQEAIIEDYMLEYIDGIECWHSRLDLKTTRHYLEFTGKHGLLSTGGSDCHQKPIIMGSVDVPHWVAEQHPFKEAWSK